MTQPRLWPPQLPLVCLKNIQILIDHILNPALNYYCLTNNFKFLFLHLFHKGVWQPFLKFQFFL